MKVPSTNNKTITEIVTFSIADTISDEEIVAIVERLEENFLNKQKGFINAELIGGTERSQWIMILHWQSQEAVDAVGEVFSTAPETEEYRNSLTSVNLHFAKQVGYWQAN